MVADRLGYNWRGWFLDSLHFRILATISSLLMFLLLVTRLRRCMLVCSSAFTIWVHLTMDMLLAVIRCIGTFSTLIRHPPGMARFRLSVLGVRLRHTTFGHLVSPALFLRPIYWIIMLFKSGDTLFHLRVGLGLLTWGLMIKPSFGLVLRLQALE